MCLGLDRIFSEPYIHKYLINNTQISKIYPNPDIEESIYYTLHSHNIYLQMGFPKNHHYMVTQ